jgi:hypothetical protein
MSVKVRGGDKWRAELLRLTRAPVVQVGIFEGSKYDAREESGTRNGEPVAQYADYHEYGMDTLPARAPFRVTIARETENWGKMLRGYLREEPQNIEGALKVLGRTAAMEVMQSIEQGLDPALEPASVKRKIRLGHADNAEVPLVLSGILLDAIEYRVRNG